MVHSFKHISPLTRWWTRWEVKSLEVNKDMIFKGGSISLKLLLYRVALFCSGRRRLLHVERWAVALSSHKKVHLLPSFFKGHIVISHILVRATYTMKLARQLLFAGCLLFEQVPPAGKLIIQYVWFCFCVFFLVFFFFYCWIWLVKNLIQATSPCREIQEDHCKPLCVILFSHLTNPLPPLFYKHNK